MDMVVDVENSPHSLKSLMLCQHPGVEVAKRGSQKAAPWHSATGQGGCQQISHELHEQL
jgi:hypothetical protein